MAEKKKVGRPKNPEGSHTCFVRVPNKLFSVLKSASEENRKTLSEIIVSALREYFKL